MTTDETHAATADALNSRVDATLADYLRDRSPRNAERLAAAVAVSRIHGANAPDAANPAPIGHLELANLIDPPCSRCRGHLYVYHDDRNELPIRCPACG